MKNRFSREAFLDELLHKGPFLIAAACLTVLCFFIGLDELFDFPQIFLFWVMVGIDGTALGFLVSAIVSGLTKKHRCIAVTTVTVAAEALISALIVLLYRLSSIPWSDLDAAVLFYMFSIPLIVTAVICLIVWIVQRKKHPLPQPDSAQASPETGAESQSRQSPSQKERTIMDIKEERKQLSERNRAAALAGRTNTVILHHPLIQHKISLLRDENTGTRDFRILVEEIAMLMGYEALRDLPTEPVEVKTPIATAYVPMLSGKKLALVPILRAGLGMVDGMLRLVPSAKVGHIGLARDEKTHEPREYYCKLPDDIANRPVILLDPMLATGGSAIQAVDFIKAKGCKSIKFMCIIAAPEGLKALQQKHPDIGIWVGTLDDRLNDQAYIVPGLGDAGDRIFGT